MYYDLTRHYVAYRCDGAVPAPLAQIHQEHLDILDNLAWCLDLFIRVDFDATTSHRHQSHLEFLTANRNIYLIVNTVGSYFYDGIQPYSINGCPGTNVRFNRLFEVIQKGFHHDDFTYLLTGRTSDELEQFVAGA